MKATAEKRITVKAHAQERMDREKLYNVDEQALIKIVKNPMNSQLEQQDEA